MWRLANVRLTALVVVGALALAVAGLLGFVTVRDLGDPPPAPETRAAAPEATAVRARRVVSRAGGYAVQVPVGMSVQRKGRTLRLSDPDRSLVVTVGPFEGGTLRGASRRLVGTLREQYRSVRVLGRQPERVDGRRALTTYGRVRNADGVTVRFAAVLVRARPENFVIGTFAALDTDPSLVLPRVNAITNGFRVRP